MILLLASGLILSIDIRKNPTQSLSGKKPVSDRMVTNPIFKLALRHRVFGIDLISLMSHDIPMARGKSGKIVVEIDPDLKAEIYRTLELKGLNMKAWIQEEGRRLIATTRQPELPLQTGETGPDS